MKKLKNGKYPESSEMSTELIKYKGNKMIQEIYELFEQSWYEEKIPRSWNEGLKKITKPYAPITEELHY